LAMAIAINIWLLRSQPCGRLIIRGAQCLLRALLTAYCLLITDYWLLVTGYWLLVTGYWLLVTGYWLLVTG
jgi:hypothetical protein